MVKYAIVLGGVGLALLGTLALPRCLGTDLLQ
jgi:hypothetical protein